MYVEIDAADLVFACIDLAVESGTAPACACWISLLSVTGTSWILERWLRSALNVLSAWVLEQPNECRGSVLSWARANVQEANKPRTRITARRVARVFMLLSISNGAAKALSQANQPLGRLNAALRVAPRVHDKTRRVREDTDPVGRGVTKVMKSAWREIKESSAAPCCVCPIRSRLGDNT